MSDKCLIPNCESKSYARGLCKCCQASVRHLIRTGKATEADMVATGLLMPAKERSSRAKDIMAEFEKRLKLERAGFDQTGKLKTDKPTPAPTPKPKPVKAPTEEQLAKRIGGAVRPRWENDDEDD